MFKRFQHSSQPITSNLIEVEARFLVTPQVRQNLLTQIGPSKEITIHDRYLSQQLALDDKWLRIRNGVWQLKLPVGTRHSESSSGPAVVCKELEGQAALLEVERLGFDVRHLDEYAHIVSVRTMWDFEVRLSWGLYNLLITVDDTSASDGFFCSIGEVETLVETKHDIKDASKVIEHVCSMYRLDTVSTVGGSKIIKYLFEKNRLLHDRLEKVGLT